MVNSILIGKVIYNKLATNSDITDIVGNKIFPLIAEQTTNYPFIVYYRTNIISLISNKDGFNEDSVNFTVSCVSADYSESIDLANNVRKSLEKRKIDTNDMILNNVHLIGIDESFEDNAYVQRLNFECTIN